MIVNPKHLEPAQTPGSQIPHASPPTIPPLAPDSARSDAVVCHPQAYSAALRGPIPRTNHDRQRWLTKPLLMPVLMVGRDRPAQRALAFGGVGDVALLGSSEIAFTAGLVSFLAGHVAWIIALRQRPGGGRLRGRPVLAAPYLTGFSALNAYLWKRTGKDRIPIIVYSAALLAMSLAALDTGSPKTAAGGALFLVSDALLALEKFGGLHLPANEGLVMATYTTAQALLAG
jgi:uncharacterized membrane protein YhhN